MNRLRMGSALLFALGLLACGDDGPSDEGDAGRSELCAGVSCSGRGECVVVGDAPSCECEAGYVAEGLACIEPGECEPMASTRCLGGDIVWVDSCGSPGAVRDECAVPCDEGESECPSGENTCAPGPEGPLAFPGALGWGRAASGGRGGEVLFVTNTDDAGPGSLRAALEASGARTVIFRVGGTIALQSGIDVGAGDVTVAGETAPGDGIQLRRDGGFSDALLTIDASNVIVRGLKLRIGPLASGTECCGDNIRFAGGSEIVLDHNTLAWSVDESIGMTSATDVTISNNIIAESLHDSSHQEGTHSKAVLISHQATRISFVQNLMAHNVDRNPLIGGRSPEGPGDEFEIVRNVIYDWDNFGVVLNGSGGLRANLINNVAIVGPSTSPTRYAFAMNDGDTVYAAGNFNKFRTEASEDEWLAMGCESGCGTYMAEPAPESWRSSESFDFPLAALPVLSRDAVVDLVLGSAGSFHADAQEERLRSEVRSGTGVIVDHPSDVGGYPELGSAAPYADEDADGMADAWEMETYGSLDTTSGDDTDADGWTNLEEFLFTLTGDC